MWLPCLMETFLLHCHKKLTSLGNYITYKDLMTIIIPTSFKAAT